MSRSCESLFQRYVPNCDIDALLAEDPAIKAAAELKQTERAPGGANRSTMSRRRVRAVKRRRDRIQAVVFG